MRHLMVAVISVLVALEAPVGAATLEDRNAPNSTIFEWIEAYRDKPKPATLPKAVKDMSRVGAFRDPEAAGFYIGFTAGALASRPSRAERLASEMLPLPPEDDWVVVRAVAWSGIPEWKFVLAALRPKLPDRQAMIDKYIAGELPTLFEATRVPPPPPRGWKALFKRTRSRSRCRPPTTSTRCGATILRPAPPCRSTASSLFCHSPTTATTSSVSPSAAWPNTCWRAPPCATSSC